MRRLRFLPSVAAALLGLLAAACIRNRDDFLFAWRNFGLGEIPEEYALFPLEDLLPGKDGVVLLGGGRKDFLLPLGGDLVPGTIEDGVIRLVLVVENEEGGLFPPAADVEVRVYLRAADDQPGAADDLLLLTRNTGPVFSALPEVHDFGTILMGNPVTFPGDYLVVRFRNLGNGDARLVPQAGAARTRVGFCVGFAPTVTLFWDGANGTMFPSAVNAGPDFDVAAGGGSATLVFDPTYESQITVHPGNADFLPGAAGPVPLALSLAVDPAVGSDYAFDLQAFVPPGDGTGTLFFDLSLFGEGAPVTILNVGPIEVSATTPTPLAVDTSGALALAEVSFDDPNDDVRLELTILNTGGAPVTIVGAGPDAARLAIPRLVLTLFGDVITAPADPLDSCP